MSAPTLRDVARLAEVSPATASRALTGNPHVSPNTRNRVIEVARQLGYHPDRVARSLRRRRSDLIGLVVSTIENPFFTELGRGAEEAARARGYNLILCNTDEHSNREATYATILDRLLVSGVIVAPAPGDGRHLVRLIEAGLPVVLVNRTLDLAMCSSVTADDEAAAFQCVSQLIAEGRKLVAAITGLPGVSTTQQRLSGYRRAISRLGIDSLLEGLEICGDASLQGGYRATCQILQRDPRPDALFVFNNLMTQGAIMALDDLGIARPTEVDVAGFGAFTQALLYRPRPLLVAQPTYEMGRTAVEILVNQVRGESTSGTEQNVVLRNIVLPRDLSLEAFRRVRLGSATGTESASESRQW